MRDKFMSATWTVLHTIAAALPENPSAHTMSGVRALMNSLAELYPCRECNVEGADGLGMLLKRATKNLVTREDVVIAMCDVHNQFEQTGKLLEKPEVLCDMEILDELWAKDCYCSDEEPEPEDPEEPIEDSEIIN